ncbi:MAG: hypothetical protein LDL13_01100 [Calditerrivibrio sp.]|nr:hypothetical protein [Calditerrivibrio sp.]MCA1932158.1 hypothetical protein [Calditerrivibrio sp.]MCA1980133.1 hypothetical protein [Calditerrivibrio sp.]
MVKHIFLSYPYVSNNKYYDIFPLFLDYDMVNRFPRGMAAKIDLISLGEVYNTFLKLNDIKEIIYMLKKNLCFDKGFFLTDFNLLMDNIMHYSRLLKNFEYDYLYFEDSTIIDFEKLSEILGKNIFVVEFM